MPTNFEPPNSLVSASLPLAVRRLNFLRWFVDLWPRTDKYDKKLTVRAAPPAEPVGDEEVKGYRALLLVSDTGIEWWQMGGDPRESSSHLEIGGYWCYRVYRWSDFVRMARSWLVPHGGEVRCFLRDAADDPMYSDLISRHNAAVVENQRAQGEFFKAVIKDTDSQLSDLLLAVTEEDCSSVLQLAANQKAPAIRELVDRLLSAFQSGDRVSIDNEKKNLRDYIGWLAGDVRKSNGKSWYLGPEADRKEETFQAYLASFEAVEAVALPYYNETFSSMLNHGPLKDLGDALFAGQAYVDTLATRRGSRPAGG